MWYLYYERTGVVFTNGHGTGWSMRKDAYEWAEANGYDLNDVLAVPGINVTED